jgi:hypothetical protein
MTHYGRKKFFESERKKRRRDPPDQRIKPAVYGMSCADLDRLTAGHGGRLLLERLEREEGEGE